MENHSITLENQSRLQITAVKSLDAFDEEAILANIDGGGIIIKGENLVVETLDVDDGILIASGKIYSISYVKRREKRKIMNPFKR